jgi:hypothetical protein
MPNTPTGYGNGTMYAGTSGSPEQTGKYRQPASHGLFNAAPTNIQQPGSPGAAAVFGGWSSLSWCKNILTIMFPFFDKSLSTPYSGQLFPTGVSVGNAGQVFPTKG